MFRIADETAEIYETIGQAKSALIRKGHTLQQIELATFIPVIALPDSLKMDMRFFTKRTAKKKK